VIFAFFVILLFFVYEIQINNEPRRVNLFPFLIINRQE